MAVIIIDIRQVVKKFKDFTAVDTVSLQVEKGEIFGLLGTNGAGKTTLLNMLMGFQKPDSGSMKVFDHDPANLPLELKEKIGIQFENNTLHDTAKVSEIFNLFASFYKSPIDTSSILKLLKLEQKRNTNFADLSKGMKHKVGLGLALIGDPDLVILDEPTSGLDLPMRRELEEALETIREKGKTVLLTTHYLDEAERLCDRVAFMNKGKIVKYGKPVVLIDSLGYNQKIEISRSILKMDDRLTMETFAGKNRVNIGKTKVTILVNDPIPVIHQIIESVGKESDMRLTKVSLEDIFFEITGQEFNHAQPN